MAFRLADLALEVQEVASLEHVAEADEDDAKSSGVSTRAVVKSSRTLKSLKATRKSRPNLIMKLPAELRNVIYQLVLTEDNSTYIRVRDSVEIRRFVSQAVPSNPSAFWSEPSLLQVSRQIRNEAETVYYRNNSFQLCIAAAELPLACAWLEAKYNLGDGHRHIDFSFYVKSGRWEFIAKWFSLAELIYNLKLGLDYEDEGAEYEFWKSKINGAYIISPVMHAIRDLARRAATDRRRGVSVEACLRGFKTWALSMVRSTDLLTWNTTRRPCRAMLLNEVKGQLAKLHLAKIERRTEGV